ncbi:hypothetical protein DITRI_Ditri06bG0132200 [Diplodiscus trichospermus]
MGPHWGPHWDLLLQHLAENDPNRYGTLAAQKEAVEAVPIVTVADCAVFYISCLRTIPIRVRQMSNGSNDARRGSRVGTGRRYWIPSLWPYDGLLTVTGSQSGSSSAPS